MRRGWQPDRITRNAVAIVAGSALLTLAGCTMLGERLTGVELSRATPTSCIQQCNNLYRNLFDAERKRHVGNVEVCNSLPQGARSPCLDEEGLRHAAEMERLSLGLAECQSSCTNRGGG